MSHIQINRREEGKLPRLLFGKTEYIKGKKTPRFKGEYIG